MPIPEPGTNEFQALLDQLTGKNKASLEAYIRKLYGESGGTIGQELAAGRMTPDQAVAMLMQAGYSPEQASYLVQSGMLNIPLLTVPGDIETRMGPRGGIRALAGPYAIERSLAAQEVARQAAAMQSDALNSMLQLSSRQGSGGGGGGGGGPEGGPEPRPPLPPIPVGGDKPPWWAAAVAPLAGVAGKGLFDWLMRDSNKKPMETIAGPADPKNPLSPNWQSSIPQPPAPPQVPAWANFNMQGSDNFGGQYNPQDWSQQPQQSQQPSYADYYSADFGGQQQSPSQQTDYGNWPSPDWTYNYGDSASPGAQGSSQGSLGSSDMYYPDYYSNTGFGGGWY